MITAIIIIVILGTAGFLVYRNNKAKAAALAKKAEQAAWAAAGKATDEVKKL
jgi:hypothetical protein